MRGECHKMVLVDSIVLYQDYTLLGTVRLKALGVGICNDQVAFAMVVQEREFY